MTGNRKYLIVKLFFLLLLTASCEKFFEPDQELVVKAEDFYADWNDYRAAEIALYSLQQNLVEQIVVLGELRADLVELTDYADNDLMEVYDYNISKENRYASPIDFYTLISACNRLALQLEKAHPEVLDKSLDPTQYDQLYGEVLCMRAWAYFNAVRIYGKIPYIWPSLTSVDEIKEYVNAGAEFIDSVDIIYHPGGYDNDTILNKFISLDKMYLDMGGIIDTFTFQLENNIKAVGVNHNMYNDDVTWEATVWNTYSWHCLLGQMYLFNNDLTRAYKHFYPIMYNNSSESSDIRFGLDSRFEGEKWKNIFSGIDIYEHIYTIWFGKSYQQQHNLQKLFSKISPNYYMLKPTTVAVHNWETLWDGPFMSINESNPAEVEVVLTGLPGDFYRGHGISYAYMQGEEMLDEETVRLMLDMKRQKLYKEQYEIMEGIDTVVYKFTYGKTSYDSDAHFPLYRAGGIHLYFAEIFARWEYMDDGVLTREILKSLNILNNGWYNTNNKQKGVRGRVGFSDQYEAVTIGNIVLKFDPFTNQPDGWYDFTSNILGKQEYIEDQIINERARELAFEGERFYDLMRIAKRRNDPSYLADRVAAKFSGAMAEQVREYLMDEENWYVPLFEDF